MPIPQSKCKVVVIKRMHTNVKYTHITNLQYIELHNIKLKQKTLTNLLIFINKIMIAKIIFS